MVGLFFPSTKGQVDLPIVIELFLLQLLANRICGFDAIHQRGGLVLCQKSVSVRIKIKQIAVDVVGHFKRFAGSIYVQVL